MGHSPGISSHRGLTRSPGWDIQEWKMYELTPPILERGDEGPSSCNFLDHSDASCA
jgi:hypothetical protein